MNSPYAYSSAAEPWWTSWIFLLLMMTVLVLTLVIASYGYLLIRYRAKKASFKAILPFLISLALYAILAVHIILPGAALPYVALLIVPLLLATSVWIVASTWKKYRKVSIINILQVLFLTYCSILELLTILRLFAYANELGTMVQGA